jgi:hypothetical protein
VLRQVLLLLLLLQIHVSSIGVQFGGIWFYIHPHVSRMTNMVSKQDSKRCDSFIRRLLKEDARDSNVTLADSWTLISFRTASATVDPFFEG